MTHDTVYENALNVLKTRLPESIFALIAENTDTEELRIRANRPISLTRNGKNHLYRISVTMAELREILCSLCDGSVHAFEESICDGYLAIGHNIRIGVAGHAVRSNNTVTAVNTISSICIRLPHTSLCKNNPLTKIASSLFPACGILIYAPPGVGKTTLLRQTAIDLSQSPFQKRIALIDTRGELYDDETMHDCLIDCLDGYPRGKGIEIATRTLSPELIICDEIGNDEEAKAILESQNAGVPLIASAHAVSRGQLMQRKALRLLCDAGVFSYIARLCRNRENGYFYFSEECDLRQKGR